VGLVRVAAVPVATSGATLFVADGAPVVWASRLAGTPLPERVSGSNLVGSLAAACAERGLSVFLAGGAPGTAEAAAGELRRRNPELRIAGFHCPPIGFMEHSRLRDEAIEAVTRSDADVVFVALGSPLQDEFIEAVHGKLPGRVWMGVGISFSFLAGDLARAPKWMQSVGLEWLFRLFQEPRRLVRRYLLDDMPFAAWLLWHSASTRRAG
jgi:N-acetylglucosaminyldiphosphoundecaprenol N-acetyl-beta-D-mannosaminyltransferase